MTSEICPQCHAVSAPGQSFCAVCGTEVSSGHNERVTLPPPATAALPPSSPPVFPPPVFGAPVVEAPLPTTRRAAPRKWLPLGAAALAILGVGLVIWKLAGSDDKSTGPAARVASVTTMDAMVATTDQSSVVETVVAETTLVETTLVEAAVSDPSTTVVPTTVPVTEPPVTAPARPPWSAPAIPDPPIFTGPGLAYAISDPLASGMPSDQPTPYMVFAQDVFDKMAADDWVGVQPTFFFQRPDGQVVPYTFDLQNQWPAADRLSLLLIDAAPDTTGLSGYDLTVAVVANFADSTSILCGHLYSDPNNYREVIQRGQFPLIADGLPPTMPEALLNDPAQVASLKASCN